MAYNLQQISLDILKELPAKQKEIISRRFGLRGGKRETLESIGKNLGITRERVRQIERDGFLRLKESAVKCQDIFQGFRQYFKKYGDLKKEDSVLADLGGLKWQSQVFFLLNLGKEFERTGETPDFYASWSISKESLAKAQKKIYLIVEELKKKKTPLDLRGSSFLEISKRIQKNSDGLYGLKEWPEINPKGVKDKAYLALKRQGRPLHFTQVAGLIEKSLPQTVHNELIKDPRFVLVGRGIYALEEWGYEKGVVKDVIMNVLRQSNSPLKKEEIVNKVLGQRLVKENTILLNLSNRKYFSKDSGGFFSVKRRTS